MKIEVNRVRFLYAVKATGAAAAARTTKPILSCIKAVASEDRVVLMGTDNEVGIRYELRGAKVLNNGSAILPPARLASILQESSDETVTLTCGPGATLVRLSTGRFELPAGNVDEFPQINSIDEAEDYHEITAGVLRTLLKRTVFAVEKRESTRYAVTGVLWETEQDKVRLVATDTRRLAIATGLATTYGKCLPADKHVIIPMKTIGLLDRNMGDYNDLIRVVLRSHEAMFQTEDAMIHTKLVEGRFPPYRNILPKSLPFKVGLPVKDLLSRVRHASIMASSDNARVDFCFDQAKLRLTAKSAETGSGEVFLDAADFGGPHTDIGIDAGYVTDLLRGLDGQPTVSFQFKDGGFPVLFLADDYVCLVMPLTS